MKLECRQLFLLLARALMTVSSLLGHEKVIVKITVSKPARYSDDSGGGGKLAEKHLGNIFTFLPLTFCQVGSENTRHGPLSFFCLSNI